MKRYITHHNGGRPFCVAVDHSAHTFSVHRRDTSSDQDVFPHEVVPSRSFEVCFVGRDDDWEMTHLDNAVGNSVLLKLDNETYMYVGERIYTFRSGEEILDYTSKIGNSDVPYPCAFSLNRVYCLLHRRTVDRQAVGELDPYRYLYGHHLPREERDAHWDSCAEEMEVTNVHGPLW